MGYSGTHTTYYNSKGEEVPSATTILKILNKPSLIHWANGLGFRHLNVDTVLEDSAQFGILIHDIVRSILLGHYIIYIKDDNISDKKIYSSIKSFKDWLAVNNVEPIYQEKSFVSDKVAGTIDFYGKINDKYTILDFKTSKQIRLSMFFQLAIYCLLVEEAGQQVDQVGILLVNPTARDEKFIDRTELDKYVSFVKSLIDLFHSYYAINNDDKWYEIII